MRVASVPRQQRRIPPGRRRIHRQRLLRTKPVQIMRSAGFGASPAQTFAAKRLHTDHCANHVAVDVDVADVGAGRQGLSAGVYPGLDAQGQAEAEGVDLVHDGFWRGQVGAPPAHDLQHRAEDFVLDVRQAADFIGCRGNQVVGSVYS